GQLTRRVVTLNAAGYTLTDKVWTTTGSPPTMSANSGLDVQYIYYPQESAPNTPHPLAGFLKEVRSYGWSAANLLGLGDTEGKVQVFQYDETLPMAYRGMAIATGVRRGIGATQATQWQTQNIRDPNRPDQVLCRIQFAVPQQS